MKDKIKYSLLIACVTVAGSIFSSCSRVLEMPVTSAITIDSIFASQTRTEQALWGVYNTCSIFEFPYFWDGSDAKFRHYGAYNCLVSAGTDEIQAQNEYTWSMREFNNGTWNPSNTQNIEFNSTVCYAGIRNANIFIANVDRSPFTDAERAQMKAEAIFLRALMHFDLMQRLGGILISRDAAEITTEGDIVAARKPRNTFDETVNFIVNSCDSAATFLPDRYESKYRGRIVKGAALALKARTLLYAASPLFNTTTPYVSMSAEMQKLVGYGNYDVNRWRLAADASADALKWALANGYELYNGKSSDPVANYEEIFINPTVSEIILDAGLQGTRTQPYFCRYMLPGIIVYNHGEPTNHAVTFNFTKFYQKKDGTDQTWDESIGTDYPYTQYESKLAELEPRFQASVFQSGTEWNRGSGVRYYFYETNTYQLKDVPGVGFVRKFLKGVSSSSNAPRWISFRTAELYLNYAEALNELNVQPDSVCQLLAAIRSRAGITNPLYSFSSQDDMRKKIRRERAVELAFEEHRYFDVRRWRVAETEGNMPDQSGPMKGSLYTLKLYPNSSSPTRTTATYRIEKIGRELSERVWDNKMYLYPFRQPEVSLGFITQNPGW